MKYKVISQLIFTPEEETEEESKSTFEEIRRIIGDGALHETVSYDEENLVITVTNDAKIIEK